MRSRRGARHRPRRSRSAPLPGDPTDPRGMAAGLAAYLEWMRTRNYSDVTVYGRRKNLEGLLRWLEERDIRRPSEVTKPVLERYQRWLFYYRKPNGDPLTVQSQHERLVAVRTFFKWLARDNRIPWNPASERELPRLEMRPPRAVHGKPHGRVD